MLSYTKTIIFILLSFFVIQNIAGQATPLNPISSRIFNPFTFNPAIIGSKDFSSVNSIAAFRKGATSQIVSGEGRLSKKDVSYFSSRESKGFRNIGVGGSLFNDLNGTSKNIGGSAGIAYHIPINKKRLSFLSFGTSVKGVMNTIEYSSSEDTLNPLPAKETFFPNIDLGLYYYGTNFYAGLSVNNLLGNPEEADSLGNFEIPVSQTNFFTTGYKIMVIRSINMVIEPSLIIEFDNFDSFDPAENIDPLLKIYMEDFCFGMFFNNSNMNSFFFQYRYPGFYLGAYYGITKNSPYFLNEPFIEVTAGINLSREGFRLVRPSHW